MSASLTCCAVLALLVDATADFGAIDARALDASELFAAVTSHERGDWDRDAGAHGRMKGRRHRAPRLAAHPPAAPAGARTRRGRRKVGTQQAGT